ncbi:hypothetical protein C8D96_0469 [Kushneria marisflavi]|nr:hypothetical protein C8D96_0469 [Kushneria marisflavi]
MAAYALSNSAGLFTTTLHLYTRSSGAAFYVTFLRTIRPKMPQRPRRYHALDVHTDAILAPARLFLSSHNETLSFFTTW